MAITVDRKESMSPDGLLRLQVQDDGDVIITVVQRERTFGCGNRRASVEFCAYSGGGGSTETIKALRHLAVAMARDNADPRYSHRRGEFLGGELLESEGEW